MKRDCIEHSGQTRRIERCCCHLVSPDGHDDGPGTVHLLLPACRVLERFNLLSRNSLGGTPQGLKPEFYWEKSPRSIPTRSLSTTPRWLRRGEHDVQVICGLLSYPPGGLHWIRPWKAEA